MRGREKEGERGEGEERGREKRGGESEGGRERRRRREGEGEISGAIAFFSLSL